MDTRLFPNDTLYCEGRIRTWLRGWFHFFMCITFFPLLLINYISIFSHSEKANTTIFIACVLNLLIIYMAHCMSAFYHICPLELPQEIVAQKMDIIGANLYVASSYLPMVFALFPTNIGMPPFARCVSNSCLECRLHCQFQLQYQSTRLFVFMADSVWILHMEIFHKVGINFKL